MLKRDSCRGGIRNDLLGASPERLDENHGGVCVLR